ncbi:MAG: PQQ-like beta-propeller repeat protein [Verrucomicrobiales bacterium]|nr:PQQ-like beta-propeller repeat protein [Verrucomicrobiales bacterium]
MTLRFYLIVMLSFAGFSSAVDWPKWLGPSENGKTSETLPENANLKDVAWEAEVGIGFSSFSVAQGKVFTMGYQDGKETVWCFSEPDGKVLWKHSYPAELMPNLHEGGPNATPTIDGDRVYAISKDGQLHCYTLSDGKILWKKNMLKEAGMYRAPEWGYGGSPYIHNDLVIVESCATFAYHKVTGEEVWRSEKYRPAYGSPQLFQSGEKSFLATLKTDGLVILDPANGKTLGFHQWRTSFQTNATTPLVVGDGQLFVSTGYDRGCALFKFDGDQLTKLYEETTMSNHMGNSVLIDGFLYGFDGTAHRGRPVEFCCIAVADGAKQWSTKAFKYGSVIAAGNELIVLTEQGEMLLGKASPQGFEPRTREPILEGRFWTPPVYANGKIYARNAAGKVVVLGVGSGK